MKLLLNDTDFKDQIKSAKSLKFDPIMTHVNTAQRAILIPLLGKDLFDDLFSEYIKVMPVLTDPEKELLTYIHPVLANLAMFKYAPAGNIIWTDSGAQIRHSGDLKSAFQWQIKEAQKHFLTTGYDAIDLLLTFLDENAADFIDYEISRNRTRIINTAADFSKYVNIRRFEFERLLPVSDRNERNIITKYLGKPLYDNIKANIAANDLTLAQKAVMTELQALLAHITYATGLVDLAPIVDEDGVHFYNNAFSGNFDGKEAVQPEYLNRLIRQHKHHADQAADNLVKFLNDNAADYPLFEHSEFYEGGESEDYADNTFIDL